MLPRLLPLNMSINIALGDLVLKYIVGWVNGFNSVRGVAAYAICFEVHPLSIEISAFV